MIERVLAALRSHRFRFADEAQLQEGIALALTGAGVAFDREVRLSAHDRLDFLVGDIAIEVKIDGGLAPLTRQVHRYLQHDRVQAVVVATSRSMYSQLEREMNGKHVEVVVLRGAM